MAIQSLTLARLIEPALHALSRPSPEPLRAVLKDARGLVREARQKLREEGKELEPFSYEIGVGTAFVELLATTEQRSTLSNAVRGAEEISNGVEALHILAFLERTAQEVTQGELADQIGVDRGNFNRQVRKLELLGLAASKRQGRKVIYASTPLGLEVLSQLRPGWRAIHPKTKQILQTEDAALTAARGLISSLSDTIFEEKRREFSAITEAPNLSVIRPTAFLGLAQMTTRPERNVRWAYK